VEVLILCPRHVWPIRPDGTCKMCEAEKSRVCGSLDHPKHPLTERGDCLLCLERINAERAKFGLEPYKETE
jgi:hypothetical protein